MVVRRWTQRPPAMGSVQWDGTNLTEVQENYPESVEDNGDGTLTISMNYGEMNRQVTVGQHLLWSGNRGSGCMDDGFWNEGPGLQELPAGAGPYVYSVTAG